MYFIKSTINNVRNFKYHKNCGLYYVSNLEKFYKNEEFLFDCYGIESNQYGIFCYSNINDVKTSIISEDCHVQNFDFAIDYSSFSPISAIIRNKNGNIQTKYGLYHFEDKGILWLNNLKVFGQNIRINNHFYHRQGHVFLKSLSLLTGEYEWEVDLGKYCTFVQDRETKQGGISSIVGVYQGKLWLMCANRRLVGLCLKTGAVLVNVWLGDLRTELQGLVILCQPIFDESTNTFIFCTYKYYFTIDVQTLSINQFQQIPFEERADNLETQTIYDGLVYFTGQHFLSNDTYESHVGVYNPKTNVILWSYGINAIINQAPQVSDGKLYVLDTDGTLHIFEKEV
jgi:hypothetical protein